MSQFLKDNHPTILSVASEVHKCLKIMEQLVFISHCCASVYLTLRELRKILQLS